MIATHSRPCPALPLATDSTNPESPRTQSIEIRDERGEPVRFELRLPERGAEGAATGAVILAGIQDRSPEPSIVFPIPATTLSLPTPILTIATPGDSSRTCDAVSFHTA